MQLMTALMIFNIASLEVSPPHGPTRHFTQRSHGIITITSHHLTPEVSPCHCVYVICQHSSDSLSFLLVWTVNLFTIIPESEAGCQLAWKWGVI